MPSLLKVKEGELKPILKRFKHLYNMDHSEDAEFNILALFILREKILGEKSFWKPYLDTIDRSYTMMDWTSEDLAMIEDESLIEE